MGRKYERKRRSIHGKKGYLLLIAVIIMVAIGISGCQVISKIGSIKANGTDQPTKTEKAEKENNAKKSKIPYQEIPEKPDDFNNRYYYQQLNERKQTVYREIVQGLLEDVEEIYLHTGEGENALQIYTNVLNDFPEFFWCTGQAEAVLVTDPDELTSYTILKPIHPYGMEERDIMQQAIDNATAECLAGISAEAPTYDKIKYVYEYIVKKTDYNLDSPDNQNIYSVLVNGQSVCAGYARTNQYLLGKLGVFTIYVTGTATSPDSGSQPHGWNIVQCEGAYYHVDVTWGDPIFTQEAEAVSEEINYDYFCCPDSDIFKTHTIDSELVVPPCTSMDYNYYLMNGMYYDSFDSQYTLDVMKNSIDSQSPSVTFKYADEVIYQEACPSIVNDLISQAAQYLADTYGLANVTYYYEANDQANRITISWIYG